MRPPFAARFAGIAALLGASSATARADTDTPTFADEGNVASHDPDRSVAAFVDPFEFAMGVFGAEVDVAVGRYLAIAGQAAVVRRAGSSDAALGVGVLAYPLGEPFRGLYLGPRATYARSLTAPPWQVGDRADSAAVGGLAGWQWTWEYGLSIRAGGGALARFGAASNQPGVSVGATHLIVVLDGAIGWAF